MENRAKIADMKTYKPAATAPMGDQAEAAAAAKKENRNLHAPPATRPNDPGSKYTGLNPKNTCQELLR